MTQSQLIQHISAFDKHIKVVKLRSKLKEESFSLCELVDLTFYPDKDIALKASRLLSTMMLKFPENYYGEIDYLIERVVELFFDWMVDPKMLVSVRASASEALFNLRHRYPWIAEDLSNQLEYIMRNATPILAARGNMILSYLHCED